MFVHREQIWGAQVLSSRSWVSAFWFSQQDDRFSAAKILTFLPWLQIAV
jgi:hypothetical protein